MRYYQRRPAPPLDAGIESIWFCENEPRPRALERILPTGAAQPIVNLKEDETRWSSSTTNGKRCAVSPGTIAGISTRFQVIDTDEQERVGGVSFRPGGTILFCATPADELCDADVPLEASRA